MKLIHVATVVNLGEVVWHYPASRGNLLYDSSGNKLGHVGVWGQVNTPASALHIGLKLFGDLDD